MEENIYQAPKSETIDRVNASEQELYIVSPKKFLILFLSTMGIYLVYWNYKNWSLYKKASGESMWPVARAIFSVFFMHKLYDLVDNKLKRIKSDHSWNPSGLATVTVIVMVIQRVLDRLISKGMVDGLLINTLAFIPFPIMCYLIYQAQKVINIACEDEEGEANSELTAGNFVWIFIGLCLWGLTVVGYLALATGMVE